MNLTWTSVRPVLLTLAMLLLLTPTAAAEDRIEKGTYEGKGTENGGFIQLSGNVEIKVTDISRNGTIKATVQFKNGLIGSAAVSGKFNTKGVLKLTGTYDDGFGLKGMVGFINIQHDIKITLKPKGDKQFEGSYVKTQRINQIITETKGTLEDIKRGDDDD